MQLLPGFGGSVPAPAAAPPPVPTRQDPAVAEAKDKLRQTELRRRGRAATILTSGQGASESLGSGTTIARPTATSLGG